MNGTPFPNLMLLPIFFLDSDNPCQDLLFFSHDTNRTKMLYLRGGKFLEKPEYPEMRRTYARLQKDLPPPPFPQERLNYTSSSKIWNEGEIVSELSLD